MSQERGGKTCGECGEDRGNGQAFLLVLLCALGCYNYVLPVFREALQGHFGLSLDRFGLLLSIGLAVGAVSSLLGGIVIERKSTSAVIRGSLMGLGCGMCILALARNAALMILGIVVVSSFFNPFYLAVQTYLVHAFPGQRRRVISLNLVATGLAGALFPLWAEFLLGLSRSKGGPAFGTVLHTPYLFVGAAMLAGAIFARAGAATGAKPPPAAAGGGERAGALDAATLGLVALTILHGAGDSSLQVWLPRVLAGKSFAAHTIAPGLVISAFSAAYVVSRLILAALPPKLGSRAMMVLPGILGGGVFLAGLLSRSQALTGLAYVAGGFIWSVEYPVMIAAVAETSGRSFARAQAIGMVGTGAAAFALSYLLGPLGSSLGEERLWEVLIPPACCYMLVGLGGMLWLVRYGRTKPGN